MADTLIGNHLEFNGLQIKQALMNPVSSDPTPSGAGQLWFNTTDDVFKYYDGTTIKIVASKTYVDALLAANNAMVFKGNIDCSANPNYPAASTGDVYNVSSAGKIGGASGEDVEQYDTIWCVRGTGWVTAIGATVDNTNGTLSDGTYTNGGAGYASTTDGSGTGATYNVTITGSTPTLVLNAVGSGYTATDTIVVAESVDFSTLATGTLDSTVSTVSDNSGDQAAVGDAWQVTQGNIDGAVTGPSSATDNAIAVYDGTGGKTIKNSLATIDASGTFNTASGQSYNVNGSSLELPPYEGTFSAQTTQTITAATHGFSNNVTDVIIEKDNGTEYQPMLMNYTVNTTTLAVSWTTDLAAFSGRTIIKGY